MKKVILTLAVAMMFASCESPGILRKSTENKNVTVDLMCTVDGRNVYRMCDNGSMVYFVINPNSATTSWKEKQGKVTETQTVTSE